jgi:hypothetical protein
VPSFATTLPSASNTHSFPWSFFCTTGPPRQSPTARPRCRIRNNSSNVITTTFQQSPASGTTTVSVSVPPGMTPAVYNVLVTGYDPVSGARGQRDMAN